MDWTKFHDEFACRFYKIDEYYEVKIWSKFVIESEEAILLAALDAIAERQAEERARGRTVYAPKIGDLIYAYRQLFAAAKRSGSSYDGCAVCSGRGRVPLVVRSTDGSVCDPNRLYAVPPDRLKISWAECSCPLGRHLAGPSVPVERLALNAANAFREAPGWTADGVANNYIVQCGRYWRMTDEERAELARSQAAEAAFVDTGNELEIAEVG